MDAGIVGEFGMEGGGHGGSLPDGDRGCLAFGGDDFDAGADMLDFRGADEDHFQRRLIPRRPSRMELSIWRP